MKFALFGAGQDGKNALCEIGKERVCYFIDNFKSGEVYGVPVISLQQMLKEISDNVLIVITSQKYEKEIAQQLKNCGVNNYIFYNNYAFSHSDYRKRLNSEEWGIIYNEAMLDSVVNNVVRNDVSIQSLEMLKLTKEKEKVLEIGCGSGETSLFLAKNSRNAFAIDYAIPSISLVNKASKKTGYKVNTYCLDALNELPFKECEFDVVFQAGLLEHFKRKQRIEMLSKWRRICKRMVSLIPNAHSLAYRVGKNIAEKNGTWQYGLEMPQSTLYSEFQKAGFTEIEEYTIGNYHALNFLPEKHYLRVALKQWFDENEELDCLGQGYLLVTVGINSKSFEEE